MAVAGWYATAAQKFLLFFLKKQRFLPHCQFGPRCA